MFHDHQFACRSFVFIKARSIISQLHQILNCKVAVLLVPEKWTFPFYVQNF